MGEYLLADFGRKSGQENRTIVFRKDGRTRNYEKPQNPITDATDQARIPFAFLNSNWASLTQEQLIKWNAAKGFTYIDRFNRIKPLFGKQLYVGLNMNLFYISFGLMDDCPESQGVQMPFNFHVRVLDATSIILRFAMSPGASSQLALFATDNMSAGVFRPHKNLFRFIETFNPVPDIDPTAAWVAKWGHAPNPGSKVFFRLKSVNETTGEASPGTICSELVI